MIYEGFKGGGGVSGFTHDENKYVYVGLHMCQSKQKVRTEQAMFLYPSNDDQSDGAT